MLCLAPGLLYAGDPSELWLKGNLVVEAVEDVRLKAEATSKFDDDEEFVYEGRDIGIIYTGIARWLDVGAYYKTVFHKIEIPGQDDVWQHENRPHLNATARFRLFGLTFSDRVQVEYNSLEDLSDYGTFRNKIAINPPNYLEPLRERWVLKDERIRPYASYEIFITSAHDVSKHRLTGGGSVKFNKRVFCDVYYMRQENSSFDSGLNVAGLTLKLLF